MAISFQGLRAKEGACAGSYTSMYSLCAKPDCRGALTDVLAEITERADSIPGIEHYSCVQSRNHPDVFQVFYRRKRFFPYLLNSDSTLTRSLMKRLKKYAIRPTRDRFLPIGHVQLPHDANRPPPKIVVSVTMIAKPDCISSMPSVLRSGRDIVHAISGNYRIEHSQSVARPEFFHTNLEWESLEAFNAYMQSPVFEQVVGPIVPKLSSRTLDILDVIGYSDKSGSPL
ncbi:hypothetical protein G5B39_11050 [Rhodobacteraceae bacterium SC52]|nr:hypothetical protein G5B39_11050 [Rhodobacteraceae bacterium SC52]